MHVNLLCKFKYSSNARIWDTWNIYCSTGARPKGNLTVSYWCVSRCDSQDELHYMQDGAPHCLALPVRQRIHNHFLICGLGVGRPT